ncbi:MAG: GGDEF domain-containing protein [Actinomycetota bacterium]|nr:GGDEF domain-containing protein [Actinomycetota bacterium]
MTFPLEDENRESRAAGFTPTWRSPRWLSIGAFALALVVATPISAFGLLQGPAWTAFTVSSFFLLTGFAAFSFNLWTTRIWVTLLWLGLGLGLLVGGRTQIAGAWPIFGIAALVGAELLSRGIESIREAAVTDPLTGLQNRTGLWEECERAISICRRSGQPLTLVHIDLDGFKKVNDRDGHAEGDRILRLCAERWTGVIRSGDVLARIGGDEFLLVLPGSDVIGAGKLMKMLRVVSPVEWCFGAAELLPGERIQTCMDRADTQLYAAKKSKQSAGEESVAPASVSAATPSSPERSG